MFDKKPSFRNPWAWFPSLYFAEGIPYIVVMTVSVIMYKRMGISNTDIALYTSWLYLPWVIKPLWSPVVDLLKTKRFWIIIMQLVIGAGLAGVALTIPVSKFFQYTLAFFWLLAFSSATHDIAADGFYMLGLSKHNQAWFVGVRSTFYRFAMITGQGLLVILAGYIESTSGLPAVDLSVNTKTNIESAVIIDPNSLEVVESNKELFIVNHPAELNISTTPIKKSEADSLIAFAKNWNTINGFYSTEKNSQNEVKTVEEPSWWEQNVSSKIAGLIKKYFGPEVKEIKKTDNIGNLGTVYLHLSQKLKGDQEIVVTFGRESGDNSISLVEGSRFIFNSNNWNKPAVAVIQIDPKLRYETSALFKVRAGDIPLAWTVTFFVLAGLFILFFIYHKFILPYPATDKAVKAENILGEFFRTFALFFKRKNIGVVLGFILLYRFAEAQLVKLASPFLLDAQEAGGLALSTGQVGFVYGTVGIVALTLGGLLGGFVAAKKGLKYWLWWMLIAINLPDLVYVYLSYTQTTNFFLINLCVAIEQFGYGFGFTAYMLYLIYISDGEHKTAHYAIATGFMALGMMLPGMFSGWLQEIIGYQHFFVWVCIATIPSFIIAKFISIDSEFGKKSEAEK